MKVSVSLTSAHTVDYPRQGARWMVERAAAARQADLDSLFLGDHHATPGKYYQNVPMLGRLLAEWGDRPAGCLFLLPLWNPVLIAEQVGTLAAIGRGRFIFQCGLGDDDAQFRAMGAQLKSRVTAFEESLAALRRLWAGDTVTASGLFSFDSAGVALRPVEPVEVWIGATVPPAIDRAARMGDGWLASPGLTDDVARQRADLYRERCAIHRREPTAVALRRDIYVGESEADARTTLEAAITRGYRGFKPEALVAGTVEQVVERFRRYEAMGYTDVIIRHFVNEQPKVLGSYGRLADVRRALAR